MSTPVGDCFSALAGAVRFNIWIFLEQMLYQMLPVPLSTVFALLLRGDHAAKSMSLLPPPCSDRRPGSHVAFWFFTVSDAVATIATIVVFSLPATVSRPTDGLDGLGVVGQRSNTFEATIQFDAYLVILAFLLHRIIVCAKYAYMPPLLYARYMGSERFGLAFRRSSVTAAADAGGKGAPAAPEDAPLPPITPAEMQSELISGFQSGWFLLPPALVASEMAAAAAAAPDMNVEMGTLRLNTARAGNLYMSLCPEARAVVAHLEPAASKCGWVDPDATDATAAAASAVSADGDDGDSGYVCPAFFTLSSVDLATALVLQAKHMGRNRLWWLRLWIYVSGFLLFFATMIVRGAFGLPLLLGTDGSRDGGGGGYVETSSRDRVIIVSHWLCNSMRSVITLAFITTAAIDHTRRAVALNLLGLLLSSHRSAEAVKRADTAIATASSLRSISSKKQLLRSRSRAHAAVAVSPLPQGMADESPGAAAAAAAGYAEPEREGDGDEEESAAASPLAPARKPGRATVELDSVSQIRAWLSVRYLILHFGARFRARCSVIITLAILSIAAAGIMMAVQLFRRSVVGSGGGGGQAWMEPVTQLILLHAIVVPYSLPVIMALVAAARVNDIALLHASLVARKRVELLFSSTASSGRDISQVSMLLDAAQQSIQADAAETPVRVVGITAGPALTQAALTACVSFESAVVGVLVSRWDSLALGSLR